MSEQESRWIKCISTDGSIRGVAMEATSLVREMSRLHGLNGMQAQGLGEVVMGALSISSYCKPGERVNLNIRGGGQFSQGLVDAYPDGAVRGYVIPRRPSEAYFGERNEFGPWGEGLMSVLRTKGREGVQPYIGTVPLLTGHLAKDLTFYWLQSEQVPSAVGLAVKVKGDTVVAAGGFLVQAMPEAKSEQIRKVEQHVAEISSLADEIARDPDPMHLLSRIFQSTAFMVLEERPLVFRCNCSQERVERALMLSGVGEMRDILEKEGKTVVRCDFCTKEYQISQVMLERLISQVSD